jgi:alpha-glucosidase
LLTLHAEESFLRLDFKGRTVFSHGPDRPGFSLGRGEGRYDVNRGNFTIRESGLWTKEAGAFTVLDAGPERVLLGFSGLAELLFEVRSGRLHLSVHKAPEEANRFLLRLPLRRGEGIYGCGEQFSRFDLRGSRVPLWTEEQGVGRSPLDPITHLLNFKHGAGGHWYSTYFPQPTFVTAENLYFHASSRAYAVFDFRPRDRGELLFWEVPREMVIGVHGDAAGALAGLSEFLGRMPVLPEWTYDGMWLGVQGGRDAVEKKLAEARDAGVKVGALWAQDWEGRRITTFGKQLFWDWKYKAEMYPDLPGHIRDLDARGVKFLGYINTFLALEGSLYKIAKDRNYCVKNRAGEDYLVYITTFPAAIVDLTNPEAFRWIKDVIKENMIGIGLSGWMADFGEYLPTDAVLASGESAELVHNEFPALWARANREAVEEAGKLGEIAFFMRAGYTGSSRWSTCAWAGDQLVNFSRHDGLASTIPAALSLGMCGTGLTHSDLGGYTTLAWVKRSRETFMRWAEHAAFTPVMRTHEGNRPDSNHQFNSSPETLRHLAKMTGIFTALKPYHMDIQKEYAATGLPAQRPLFLHYPGDPAARRVQYQYLYGRDLLVAPVITEGAKNRRVYLPEDRWVHLWSGKEYGGGAVRVDAPLGSPPVFYRKDSDRRDYFASLGRIG